MDLKTPPKVLLLVEDEAATARLLAKMLREDGFDVKVAFDGASAIGMLTQDDLPDALVADLRMPLVDGLTVARYARSRRPQLPIVFVTGYPQLVAGDALDPPPPMVCCKPVDYSELNKKLHQALRTAALGAWV